MEQFLNTEFFGFLTGRSLLIVIHLFGVALGAGAAFFSDFLFTHILKDRKINKDEFGILQLASMVVWIGITVLVASGLLMFLGNPEGYLESAKFLAKMSIVGILIVNGVIFHRTHIPLCRSLLGKDLRQKESENPQLRAMFVSGAISGVSWASALILGALRVPYSYLTIMGIYAGLVALAAITGLGLYRYYFFNTKPNVNNSEQRSARTSR